MHRSHLPLKTWFLAAHIVATHSNGISALQLQGQLGLGRYKTAWLLLQKLRRAMVDPGRSPLQTLVEIDETEMPFRSKQDPMDKKKAGRSPVGKIFILGAVELCLKTVSHAAFAWHKSPMDPRRRCMGSPRRTGNCPTAHH